MIRISITGPESSGKTELSEWLAYRIPHSVLIPEFARAYLESKPASYRYTSEDILHCAKQTHQQIIDTLRQAEKKALICDTDFYVLGIWQRVVFGEPLEQITKLRQEQFFDIYLLCTPDIPWHYDPLRENEYDRDKLFRQYESELKRDNVNYIIVKGEGESRFENALEHLLRIFPSLILDK